MASGAGHPVRIEVAAPRAVAAVRASLLPAEVPRRFAHYLDQVYAASRAGGIRLDGQNIFVYRAGPVGATDVEFAVGVTAPFEPVGSVRPSALPVGEVATTTHWGDYAGLGDAHGAIVGWCAAHGRERTGTSWEVYGHWSDDPAQRRTDVYHLLRAAPVA